jgi:hypothetical protein
VNTIEASPEDVEKKPRELKRENNSPLESGTTAASD